MVPDKEWSVTSPEPLKMVKNVGLCSLVWLIGVSVLFLQITTTSSLTTMLVGPSLSTVPVGIFLVSNALAAGVVPTMIARYGGKPTYVTLYFLAAIGATVQFCGVKFIGFDNPMGAFGLLVAGAVPQGISNACTNNVRFTATLFVEPDRAPTAISTVIFMGSSAAFFGPELSKYTRVWLPEPFAGTYILATIYWILLLIFSLAIDFPKPPPRPSAAAGTAGTAAAATSGRPIKEIASSPVFMFAICMQTIAFAGMAGLMTATPVSMNHNMFDFDQSLSVIQGHLVGMFAPALFTSTIISSFGVLQTICAGMLVLLAGVCILYAGATNFDAYMAGLFFIGLGWAWSYVAATSLFVKQFTLEEKSKVLSLNDFIIFSFVAICTASSGAYFVGVGNDWYLFCATYSAFIGTGLLLSIAALSLDLTGERRKNTHNLLKASEPISSSKEDKAVATEMRPLGVPLAPSPTHLPRHLLVEGGQASFMPATSVWPMLGGYSQDARGGGVEVVQYPRYYPTVANGFTTPDLAFSAPR